MPRSFLKSPAFDLGWFVAPGLLAAAVAVAVGVLSPDHDGDDLLLWIVAVLLVDVAHVYASLYRTYLDPVARDRHRARLIAAPLLCAWLGFLLHAESPLLFWGAMAYVAIFHFIKQHVGFALLYVRAAGEARLDRRLTELAVWAGTLGPVLWWHAALPRRFAWFMQGDLLALPAWLGPLALALEVPIWLAFLARRVHLWRRGRPAPMVPLLALTPALCWHLGIVVFDDDRIFTITNVFLHGVPYLALVWLAGGRDRVVATTGPRPLAVVLVAFYGLLAALAIAEELAWDRLVWHDRPELFGAGEPLDLHPVAAAAITALLAVPQATHYLLDRWIWRVGPDNPALARQLGFEDQPTAANSGR
jgi:hypothetical protein